jgi:alpha-glucosidase
MVEDREAEPVGADSKPWWRDAVIYQVYPRSFADADGDGVGDLPGVISRLPHLADLGVDALWLSPFYRSPMVDAGYDVADYRDVDPIFGTLTDFDTLLAEAHRLGLKVIIDLVPNHSSSAHPWFVEAISSPAGSPARQRYVFRDGDGQGPPNDWQSIFGGPAWTQVSDGQWYLHLFDPGQPDFNWDDPEVHAEFHSILRFWLDRGVDGFRIDVAHGLVKADGLPSVGVADQSQLLNKAPLPYLDQDGVHDIYRSWRRILDSYRGDRIAVAEAWAPTPERTARYVRPDELHQAFDASLLNTPWSAEPIRKAIDASLAAVTGVGAPTTWVLSNHDFQRHVTRYGGGELGVRRARAAILLMLALPGCAYLYQGDELGLPEVLDLPDGVRQDPQWFRTPGSVTSRDGCRVPIPWSGASEPFGFSPPNATAAPWLPMPSDWATLAVERQREDPRSMLNLYRRALWLRRQHPGLRWNSAPTGSPRWLPESEGVLAFSNDRGFTCVVNLSGAPVRLEDRGELLAASGPIDGTVLPSDTAGWWFEAS